MPFLPVGVKKPENTKYVPHFLLTKSADSDDHSLSPYRKELIDALEEISLLRIHVVDIRYQNTLSVLPSEASLPSLPSPYTGKTYSCRIIDLEIAVKSTEPSDLLHRLMKVPTDAIFMNLPYNCFTVPPF